MKVFRPMSTSDQLAEHLRREIRDGKMSGDMPGIKQLVRTFGVNSEAVAKAVRQLERDGLVISQGSRRARRIAPDGHVRSSSLKIGMLYYDATNAERHDAIQIKQELANAGHVVMNAPKSMLEMGMDAKRTAKLVGSMDVDAWVVYAGSRQILEWFAGQDQPAFALHGRHNHVDLASFGIRKSPVISTLIGKLVALGHSRIVMLAREERRHPQLGLLEQFFIDELEARGIRTGPYNIPDWSDSPEGLVQVIDSLFKHTPPTAIIVGDSTLFHAVQIHLAHKGILAPKYISLFCNDFEESFRWTRPEVSHIRWDHRPSIRRVLQWAKNVAQGHVDRKKTFIKAVPYEGGTIGTAPLGR